MNYRKILSSSNNKINLHKKIRSYASLLMEDPNCKVSEIIEIENVFNMALEISKKLFSKFKEKIKFANENLLENPILSFYPRKDELILINTKHNFRDDINDDLVSDYIKEYTKRMVYTKDSDIEIVVEHIKLCLYKEEYEFYLEQLKLIVYDRLLATIKGEIFAVTKGPDKEDIEQLEILEREKNEYESKIKLALNNMKNYINRTDKQVQKLNSKTINPNLIFVNLKNITEIFDFISFLGAFKELVIKYQKETNEFEKYSEHIASINKFLGDISPKKWSYNRIFDFFTKKAVQHQLPFPNHNFNTNNIMEKIFRDLNKKNDKYEKTVMIGVLDIEPVFRKKEDDNKYFIITFSGNPDEKKRLQERIMKIKRDNEVYYFLEKPVSTFHFQDVPTIREGRLENKIKDKVEKGKKKNKRKKKNYEVVRHNGHSCAQHQLWKVLEQLNKAHEMKFKAMGMEEKYHTKNTDNPYAFSKLGNSQLEQRKKVIEFQLNLMQYKINRKSKNSNEHSLKIGKSYKKIKKIEKEKPTTPFYLHSKACPGCQFNAHRMFDFNTVRWEQKSLDLKVLFTPKSDNNITSENYTKSVLLTPPKIRRKPRLSLEDKIEIERKSRRETKLLELESPIRKLSKKVREIGKSIGENIKKLKNKTPKSKKKLLEEINIIKKRSSDVKVQLNSLKTKKEILNSPFFSDELNNSIYSEGNSFNLSRDISDFLNNSIENFNNCQRKLFSSFLSEDGEGLDKTVDLPSPILSKKGGSLLNRDAEIFEFEDEISPILPKIDEKIFSKNSFVIDVTFNTAFGRPSFITNKINPLSISFYQEKKKDKTQSRSRSYSCNF